MSRKSEARAERKLAKAAKDANKSARLVQRPSDAVVRFGGNPNDVYSQNVEWTCDKPDRDGRWSWGVDRAWSQDDWDTIILPKLTHFSGLTWKEVDTFSSDGGHKLHHFQDVESICAEAQARFKALELSSDRMFRFRLGNKQRLWGMRVLARFEVVWYDPTHNIYPTDDD